VSGHAESATTTQDTSPFSGMLMKNAQNPSRFQLWQKNFGTLHRQNATIWG